MWRGHTQNERIAEDDVMVYKVFMMSRLNTNILTTPYKRFQYEEGKTYHAKIYTFVSDTYSGNIKIDSGIHCYSKQCEFLRYSESDITMRRASTIHVKLEKEQSKPDILSYRADMYYHPVVVECIIPKGTRYFINTAGEIVTESLTVDYVTRI